MSVGVGFEHLARRIGWLVALASLSLAGGCKRPQPCALPSSTLSVRPNLDDDDGDGRIDGLQEPPPASDDDLTVMELELASSCEGAVTHDAPLGEVRVWRRVDAGWAPLPRLKEGRHQLGIEVVRGRSPDWNGHATLRLSSADAGAPLETPPFLLRRAETPMSEVWVSQVRGAELHPNVRFLEQLEAALPKGLRVRRLPGDGRGADRWVQDAFQAASVGGVPAMIRLPRAGPTRGLSELTFANGLPRDTGVVGTGVLGDSRFDYGGNLEVLSAHRSAAGSFPVGRLVVGEDVGAELTAWLDAQGAQAPPVKLSTGWLESGHVDDVLMPLPSSDGGVRVAFASTRLATEAWRSGLDAGLLAFNTECQGRLDAIEAVLKKAVAPAALELVYLPVLFAPRVLDAGVFARAVYPNPINAFVVETTVLAGSVDGGRHEQALQAVTTARLGELGLTVRWLDVTAYAPRGGSVHCALEGRTR